MSRILAEPEQFPMIREFLMNGLHDTDTVARSHSRSLHVSLLIHATRYGLNHGRGLCLHLKEVNFPDYENHRESCSEEGGVKKDSRAAQSI